MIWSLHPNDECVPSFLFMKLNILIWNCQGCEHLNFYYFLKEYHSEFDIDVAASFEPRSEELSVDSVIRKLGFGFSSRIEANGFGGGI